MERSEKRLDWVAMSILIVCCVALAAVLILPPSAQRRAGAQPPQSVLCSEAPIPIPVVCPAASASASKSPSKSPSASPSKSPSPSSSPSPSPSITIPPTDEKRNTNVTIGYRAGAFRGSVFSSTSSSPRPIQNKAAAADQCERGRKVVLKQKKAGRDPVIGRTKTNKKGKWKVVSKAHGKFYAKAKKKTFTKSGTKVICKPDTSRTISH